MLDLSSNMASNRNMDGLGVSGMLILGGIDTKFGYLALMYVFSQCCYRESIIMYMLKKIIYCYSKL